MVPLMGYPNIVRQAAPGRETILPVRGGMDGQMPGQNQPFFNSPSASLFSAYMSGLFNNRYQPTPIQGIFGNTGRGYNGFLSPMLPRIPQAQQPAPSLMGPRTPQTDPSYTWGEYLNAGGSGD